MQLKHLFSIEKLLVKNDIASLNDITTPKLKALQIMWKLCNVANVQAEFVGVVDYDFPVSQLQNGFFVAQLSGLARVLGLFTATATHKVICQRYNIFID
jgi:hypothetical protein